MNKYLSFIVLAAIVLSCSRDEAAEKVPEKSDNDVVAAEGAGAFVAGKAIVKLSEEMTAEVEEELSAGILVTRSEDFNNMLRDLGVVSATRLFPYAGEFEERTRREGLHLWYILEYSDEVSVTKAESALGDLAGVEIVEPVRKIKIDDYNDSYWSNMWGLNNRSYSGVDINVKPVWENYTTGDPEVIVSVVDGGIDLNHPDLASNCSKKDNYNTVDGNYIIVPHEHGTHVAGTIAAVSNNGTGVTGVAGGDFAAGKPGVTLLSCQVFKTLASGDVAGNTATAIKWGADHGAVISQNSWGYNYDANDDGKLTGSELTRALAATIGASDKAAVDYFVKYAGCDNNGDQLPDSPMKGGVVIFSAGNDGITNGAPANYDKVIAVAAIKQDGTKASFSNYGTEEKPWVDIAAPGVSIFSTLPNSRYGYMQGTSMACPHVSGVAALVVSYLGKQGFTNDMLTARLVDGANKEAVSSSYMIGGLVDALGAITYGGLAVPDAITDLSGDSRASSVELNWTVTKDENDKPAYGALVLYDEDRAAVEKATPQNHSNVKSVTATPGLGVGEKASLIVGDLEFDTQYYFKIYAYSYGRTYSAGSDVLAMRTTENRAPVIDIQYDGSYLFKSFEQIEIPVSVVEPDGHKFYTEYYPGSAADSFKYSKDGNSLLTIACKDADAGTYTGTIKAVDEYGVSNSMQFTYTILENHAPIVVKEVEDMIFESVGKEFSLDMSEYVNDPDGETLIYNVTISNNKVIHIDQQGHILIGSTLNYGICGVVVTASDAKGAKCEFPFNIAVPDPSEPVRLYPNPVRDILNIATVKQAKADITIHSSNGKKVYESSAEVGYTAPVKVNMAGNAPGKYVVKVKIGNDEYTSTIVKL